LGLIDSRLAGIFEANPEEVAIYPLPGDERTEDREHEHHNAGDVARRAGEFERGHGCWTRRQLGFLGHSQTSAIEVTEQKVLLGKRR
jgi:hypothetical protein